MEGSNISKVRYEELELITSKRIALGLPTKSAPFEKKGSFKEEYVDIWARENKLCGLALSGGGIRSASFNLGILQTLARHQFIRRIDYLSTVSGGGYIGGWMTSMLQREHYRICMERTKDKTNAFDVVEKRLSTNHTDKNGQCSNKDIEDPAISHLRSYSNYLTPKFGFFTVDTWAIINTYLRNVLLNQSILILTISILLLFPRISSSLLQASGGTGIISLASLVLLILVSFSIVSIQITLNLNNREKPNFMKAKGDDAFSKANHKACISNTNYILQQLLIYFSIFILLYVFKYILDLSISSIIVFFLFCLAAFETGQNVAAVADTDPAKPNPRKMTGVLVLIVAPLLIGAILVIANIDEIFQWATKIGTNTVNYYTHDSSYDASNWIIFGFLAIGTLLVHWISWVISWFSAHRAYSLGWIPLDNKKDFRNRWNCIVLAAAPSALLLTAILLGIHHLLSCYDNGYMGIDIWLGPPLLLLGVVLAETLHIGLASDAFKSQQREWLSRVGAWIMIIAVTWFLIFGVAIAGPFIIYQLIEHHNTLGTLLASGWAGAIIAGLISGRGAKERESIGKSRKILIAITPYLFIAGLLIILSATIQSVLHNGLSIHKDIPQITVRERIDPNLNLFEGQVDKNNDHYTITGTFKKKPEIEINLNESWKKHLIFMRDAEDLYALLILFAFVSIAAYFLSIRFDINEFSLHNMYKNRLVRCYLGATTECRFPNPFTGFSMQDDFPLWTEKAPNTDDYNHGLCKQELDALWGCGEKDDSARPRVESHNREQEPRDQNNVNLKRSDHEIFCRSYYPGPYHLINTSINLVKGKRLAWQERKAAPFLLSPLYCGFQLPQQADPDRRCREDHSTGASNKTCNFCIQQYINRFENHSDDRKCPFGNTHDVCLKQHSADDCGNKPSIYFRPTKDFASKPKSQPLTLGDAIATSGAAASPNMGYHTTPAFAFLMAIFNFRLGRWIGNPIKKRWESSKPGIALFYLLQEVFGLSNENSNYVYLSDGGHFENLGIYELVRRKCRYIIACDAGADPDYQFEDLANAIRKCRIDLSVDIDIDVSGIRSRDENNCSSVSCAIGKIHYSEDDVGTLLYIKASSSKNMPTDIQHYASLNKTFPHQKTSDQFFSESQFESYRRLGIYIANSCFEGAQSQDFINPERLFNFLRLKWHKRSLNSDRFFTKHTETLVSLFKELRERNELAFLDREFYPECRNIPATQVSHSSFTNLFEYFALNNMSDPNAKRQINSNDKLSTGITIPSNYMEFRAGFYFCNSLIQLMENVYLDLNLEEEYQHPENSGWMNLFMHWSWSDMFYVTWSICATTYGLRFRQFCERRLKLKLGTICTIKINASDLNIESPTHLFNKLEIEKITNAIAVINKSYESKGNNIHIYQLNMNMHNRHDTQSLSCTTSKPCEHIGSGKDRFNFYCIGYAIISNHDGDDKKYLHSMRIRDHLRRMDLGQRSLRVIIKQNHDIELSKTNICDHSHYTNFNSMFNSVKAEVDDMN